MITMELTDISGAYPVRKKTPLFRRGGKNIAKVEFIPFKDESLTGFKAPPELSNGAYWHAVHVKSRHEFKVVERLTKTGVETFLPAVERLSRWKDRKKLINFPLFPGYIFVHIHKIYEAMLTVLKTHGVVRFLGINQCEPEPVSEDQIISLKKLVESKESLDPYPYLKEGQRVRIKRGPLAGVEGILAERKGQHLLVLSVDILRQGVSLKIDASDVEKA